jgi:hypothetical protein
MQHDGLIDVDEALLEDTYEVIRCIEEALAANEPYNNPEYDPEYTVTWDDCELPDHIEDPLRLLRVVLGHEQTGRLEYFGDLELTAEALREVCLRSRAQAGGSQGEESDHGGAVEGEEEPVCA